MVGVDELIGCLHKLRLANAGHSEKMELVYNYICSPQFAQRVRGVVEGFEELRSDLQKEREAELTRVTTGMLSMVGDLQGIGGVVGQLDSIAVIPALEEVVV